MTEQTGRHRSEAAVDDDGRSDADGRENVHVRQDRQGHLTEAFLQAEIDADRRSEYRLLFKTLIALVFVAVIAVLRQAFFA